MPPYPMTAFERGRHALGRLLFGDKALDRSPLRELNAHQLYMRTDAAVLRRRAAARAEAARRTRPWFILGVVVIVTVVSLMIYVLTRMGMEWLRAIAMLLPIAAVFVVVAWQLRGLPMDWTQAVSSFQSRRAVASSRTKK